LFAPWITKKFTIALSASFPSLKHWNFGNFTNTGVHTLELGQQATNYLFQFLLNPTGGNQKEKIKLKKSANETKLKEQGVGEIHLLSSSLNIFWYFYYCFFFGFFLISFFSFK